MVALTHTILTTTVVAGGPVMANHFVDILAAYPIATPVIGVARSDAEEKGDLIPVDVIGLVLVVAQEDLTKGDAVGVDAATGKAVKGGTIGVALSDAAAGGLAEILLGVNAQLATIQV